ncbi:MAG: TVP38/TMEM64 family protein [Alphaproteobacteria bacterium]
MAKRLLPIFIILAGVGLAYWLGFFSYFSLDALKENRAWLNEAVSNNYILTVSVFILIYIGVTAFFIPGALWLSITAGFLFGPVLGTLYSVTGATIGACILFFAVKTAFGSVLRDKAGPWLKKFADGFSKDAFSYMLTLRLVPLFPFSLVNLVPSLLGVKFRTFAIATFIGIIPGGFVFNLIGNSIGATLDQGGEPDLSLFWSPQVLAPILGLAALSLIPVIYKRFSNTSAA